jgi:ankyrin repeat protein
MQVARFLIQANVPNIHRAGGDLLRRQNHSGYTALDVAVRQRNHTLAKVLLDESEHIQLNQINHHLFTEAIDSGSADMVRLLMEANYNQVSSFSVPDDLLKHACGRGDDRSEVIEVLINYAARRYIERKVGNSDTTNDPNFLYPLHIVVKNYSFFVKESNHVPLFVKESTLELINTLLNTGEGINTCDKLGFSPLHIAAMHGGDSDLAEHLIHHGAISDMPSRMGSTPLLLAVKNKNMRMVSALLKFDASINKGDQYGYTPLMAACLIEERKMSEDLIRELIIHGHCNVNLTDNIDQSALTLCIRTDKKALAEILAFEANANLEFDDVRRSFMRFSICTTGRFLKQYLLQLMYCRSCFRSKKLNR